MSNTKDDKWVLVVVDNSDMSKGLKHIREEFEGLTLDELEEKTGIKVNRLSKLEDPDDSSPAGTFSFNSLSEIAETLGYEATILLKKK